MPPSTLRRFSAVVAMATAIVFASVIGYMVTTHTEQCRYEHMTELERRAVTAATLLDILPSSDGATKLASFMRAEASTSNELTVHTDSTDPYPTGSSTEFPFRTTVASIGANLTVTEMDAIEPAFSCAPLTAGQGLCVLLCYLAVQIGFVQFGNLLSANGRRLAGIVSCCIGLVSGVAFVVGAVVLMGTTQRSCAMYDRAEAMRSTVVFNTEVMNQLIAVDSEAVTRAKIQLAMETASSAMGPDTTISLRNLTFPTGLPYYFTMLGGGTMPAAPFAAFHDPDRGVVVVATYKFSDYIGDIVFYVEERPVHRYILDEEYVGYALTLGLVPYVAVMVAALVLLPYPSLGTLENGSAGVFPWQWRISRYAALTKWMRVALTASLVVGMCTIGVSATYGNRAVYEGLMQSITAFKAAATVASDVAKEFLDILVQITNRSVSDAASLHFSSTVATTEEAALLDTWYLSVMGRVGTVVYNGSSIIDEVRASGVVPSFVNQTGMQDLMLTLTSEAATTIAQYGTFVDFCFLVFARNSNYTLFQSQLSHVRDTLRPIANESSEQLGMFDDEWSTYIATVSSYITIATVFRAQPYTTKDIRDFFATSTGVIATETENSIIQRSLLTSSTPPFTARISVPYATYQITSALGTIIPAVILLCLLSMCDAVCTHYFFGLSHRWVPSNDPTSVTSKIRIDHPRLSQNLRRSLGITAVVCLVLVVLSSIFYAQAIEDAELRYNEDVSAVTVAVAQKRLYTAQANFMATSFLWTRGSLSRSDDDLVLAVSGVLGWADYFSHLATDWPGPTTSAVREKLSSSYTALSSVTHDAVLVCGMRVISITYAFDQLTQILDNVFAIPEVTVPRLRDCFGSDGTNTALSILLRVYLSLLDNTIADTASVLSSEISALSDLNSSCSITQQLHNMSYYLPFVDGLHFKDDRISVPVMGSYLKGNATAAQEAVAPLSAFVPDALQMSGHFAVFWVPVMLCWLVVPLVHVLWRRTSDTVKALQ